MAHRVFLLCTCIVQRACIMRMLCVFGGNIPTRTILRLWPPSAVSHPIPLGAADVLKADSDRVLSLRLAKSAACVSLYAV